MPNKPTDLALAPPEGRVAALGRERDRLLKEIATRRKEFARVERDMEAARDEILTHLGPLAARQRAVESEIQALFRELFSPGRFTKRQRAEVREVYDILLDSGLIARDGGGDGSHDPHEGDPFGGFFDGVPFSEGERITESARKPLDDGKHGTLRALFKRLVVALHPDRAQHDDERARRTAAMKDVTRAYESGDLARMMELVELLSPDSSSRGAGPLADAELAARLLERTVAELKSQLREILDDLRGLRRSDAFRATKDLGRVKNIGEDPVACLKKDEQRRLDDLTAVRDFVAAFHTGKISIDEFLDGPTLPSDADSDLLTELLDVMVAGLDSEVGGRGPRRRRKKPRAAVKKKARAP